jgi:hypothetical protein
LAAAWLFVSDVHLDIGAPSTPPVRERHDTNIGLLDSALAAMQRVDPHPPVVVIDGDFVAHHADPERVLPAIDYVAQAFGRTFPDAQFVIALGNNDSPCGDYGVSVDGPFLRAVARAWEPLVNRRNAAPDFARRFAHDGFYTARLPAGIEAVVIDDVAWTPLAHGCGATADPGDAMMAELGRALGSAPAQQRWIVMHVPPGIDPFTTLLFAHQLAIVPFLKSTDRSRFEALATAPGHGVALVLAGHMHRFAYRILAARSPHPVPLLAIPAISPVYGDAPAFLTVDVAPDGTVRNAEEHAFDGSQWNDIGGLRTLGVNALRSADLASLQQRLAADAGLRRTFAQLYGAHAGRTEIDEGNWRAYWCAASELAVTPYRTCLGAGGWRIVTRRGFIVLGGVLIALIAALAALVVVIRRRTAAPA